MLDQRWEHCLCLEPMLLTPFHRLMGKGKDVYPSFARNPMMPLCFVCFSLCVAIQLMDHIDLIVSCMSIREPMSLLKLLYQDCVGMVSYVHNRTHSCSVHGA